MGGVLRRGACASVLLTLLVIAPAWAGSVTYQGDAQHSGSVADGPAPPLAPRWAIDLKAPSSYPIVAGGKVFVTTKTTGSGYGTTLYAFDAATGAIAWSRSLQHTYYWSTLAYEDGKLFALDYNGVLQAFAADTGAALWGRQLAGQYSFSSAPTASGGVVYTGGAGSGGTVYAVRASDGQVLWTAPVANGDMSSPSVDSAHVYVSYACNQAYSFAVANGAQAWHHSTGCSGGGGKTTVLHDGRLYIRDSGGPNLILDAATGAELGAFGSATAPAFSGDVGLFVSGGTLAAERMSTRVPIWSFTGDRGLASAPFAVGTTVYEGSSTGGLFALDRETGTLLWSDCLPGPVAVPDEQNVSQPLTGIGAGDGLLVVPAGTWLVAYESRAGAGSFVCAGGGLTAGTTGPPPGAALTLAANHTDIAYGQVVTLRGRAAPGAQVQLVSDAFPFDRFTPRKSTVATADGSFSFRVRPDRNTSFKAIADGAESAAVVVYADARVAFARKLARGGRRLSVGVAAKGPRDLPLKGRVVHFYYRKRGAREFRHVATARFRRVKAGVFATGARWRVRGYSRRDRVIACTKEKTPDAWGRPTALDRVCGAKRLRLG